MSEPASSGWKTWHVLLVMVFAACVAAAAMAAWSGYVVDPWAHRVEGGYSVPGTYGDSFAPVVGLLTALALGAAVASVFMQRAELELQRIEMREAREQFTAQAEALEDANKLSALSGRLAAFEIAAQIDQLGTMAVAARMKFIEEWEVAPESQARIDTAEIIKLPPELVWEELLKAYREQRLEKPWHGQLMIYAPVAKALNQWRVLKKVAKDVDD